MRRLFVMVPSLAPTGPVKGAIALANALSERRETTLVAVKPGPGAAAPIRPEVRVMAPEAEADRQRVRTNLATALAAAGGRGHGAEGAAMISYCLSADRAARRLRRRARWISSVRGNLPRNYRYDYGAIGPLVATGHLVSLRAADRVVAMTDPMADQVARFIGRRPLVIGNFVDEPPLEPLRRPARSDTPQTFAFLGSLSARKQPLAVVEAARRLVAEGTDLRLMVMGDGPLAPAVAEAVGQAGLADRVTLHGQVAEPLPLLASADALVLPSMSEGVSRAVLEALQLGVPVVLRDVDGNRSVVETGRNGVLFDRDGALPDAMIRAARLRRSARSCESLLPAAFRQASCAEAFLTLAEAP